MGSTFTLKNSRVIEYKVNGKTKRKFLGHKDVVTKTMAKEVLKQRERQVKLGEYDLLDAKIPEFNEFADGYLRDSREVVQKRSWKRDEGCLKHFRTFFKGYKLSEITPRMINDYKRIRSSKVKPGTIDRELAVLKNLFNIAKKDRVFFGVNPVSEAGLIRAENQKERILSYEEEQRLINASPPHLRDILHCALHTGMRLGEIISLKWDDVNLETDVMTIQHTNTKSKKTRKIPINSVLRSILLQRKLMSGGKVQVFLNSNGEPYQRNDSVNQVFRKAKKAAGIEDFRFHDTRHTAGTRMSENGANVVALKEILGHSDIRTTMRYVHPSESLKEAVELLVRTFSEPVTDVSTDI